MRRISNFLQRSSVVIPETDKLGNVAIADATSVLLRFNYGAMSSLKLLNISFTYVRTFGIHLIAIHCTAAGVLIQCHHQRLFIKAFRHVKRPNIADR